MLRSRDCVRVVQCSKTLSSCYGLKNRHHMTSHCRVSSFKLHSSIERRRAALLSSRAAQNVSVVFSTHVWYLSVCVSCPTALLFSRLSSGDRALTVTNRPHFNITTSSNDPTPGMRTPSSGLRLRRGAAAACSVQHASAHAFAGRPCPAS